MNFLFILLLPVGILLAWLFSFIPETVENLYSNGFYRIFSQGWGRVIGFADISG